MGKPTAMILNADFVADTSTKRLGFTGARCELPNGRVVGVQGQRSPLYAMARELKAMGFGDWKLQAYTPTGTPSLRGKVSVMAGLAVKERDKGGLRLEPFQKFPGRPQDVQLGPEGTSTTREPGNAPERVTGGKEAA